MWLWALWAGCAEPPDDVILYAEGDGRVCVDADGAMLTVIRDCAVTCEAAVFQGRCEAVIRDGVQIPATEPTVGVAVVVTSEILVKQPEACPPTACTTLSVSCPLPPDSQGLPIVWGDEAWLGLGELDVCFTDLGDTGAR